MAQCAFCKAEDQAGERCSKCNMPMAAPGATAFLKNNPDHLNASNLLGRHLFDFMMGLQATGVPLQDVFAIVGNALGTASACVIANVSAVAEFYNAKFDMLVDDIAKTQGETVRLVIISAFENVKDETRKALHAAFAEQEKEGRTQ